MFWHEDTYTLFLVNFVSIILELGLTIYVYRLYRIYRGGTLARGIRILVAAPVFMILSALGDALSELGYGAVFETAHDVFRITFVLLLFLGFRSMVMVWREFSKQN
jgi:hypothetical protein